jgi:chloramphenicol O-acetyltransferase
MNQLIDELITSYKSIKKRKQIMKREIEDFMRFYIASIENYKEDKTKYLQYKTLGLAFIEKNKNQIYQKISEAVQPIHSRSKINPSITASKAFGFGRRRAW